jgi:hypothetical protein
MVGLCVLLALMVAGVADAQIRPIEPLRPIQALNTFANPYSLGAEPSPFGTDLGLLGQHPYKNPYSSAISSHSFTNPAAVVSPDGEYLGSTTANKYDPNSINNPYGQHGSRYAPNSVNNPYGRYGSRYSPESANNPYTTTSPELFGETADDYRGRLSANKYDAQSVENRFSPRYDKPLATQRQLLRRQIVDAFQADPVSLRDAYSKLSTSQRKALLNLLKEE